MLARKKKEEESEWERKDSIMLRFDAARVKVKQRVPKQWHNIEFALAVTSQSCLDKQ